MPQRKPATSIPTPRSARHSELPGSDKKRGKILNIKAKSSYKKKVLPTKHILQSCSWPCSLTEEGECMRQGASRFYQLQMKHQKKNYIHKTLVRGSFNSILSSVMSWGPVPELYTPCIIILQFASGVLNRRINHFSKLTQSHPKPQAMGLVCE